MNPDTSRSSTNCVYHLKDYLKEVWNAFLVYKGNIDEPLNVTLGNISCDMDSAIGAILLGYYMTLKNDYRTQPGNLEVFWLPVINCPRKEIVARLDICFHLKKFGVNIDELVYIDDINLDHYSTNDLLSLAIIDHNVLDVTQEAWGKSVVKVVDHHKDEGAYKHLSENERHVTFCGSACSIVIEYIFKGGFENCLCPEIFNFFCPAILLDTENFKPSLEDSKWGKIDKDAIFKINRFNTEHYFNELISKKTDPELNIKLGLELILRKDYKNFIWKNCFTGISVVFNPIHSILFTFGVDKVKEALKARMAENNLHFYMIISQIYSEKGAQRELMLYDDDTERLVKVAKEFEVSKILSVRKKFTGLKGNFLFYSLKDESLSRKKIEPVFREIFQNFS